MTERRPVTLRTIEMASVAGFAAACGALVMRMWSAPWEKLEVLPICAGAVLGYLLADVVSGLVHWICDTFFQDDTPLIGRAFIQPFREHHVDPLAITRHGFLEVNGNSCLALLLPVTAVLLLGAPGRGEAVPAVLVQTTILSFALTTFATNQFHKWAHQPRPAAAVRWLQASGLILSPAHHRLHHSPPYRQAFCITAGWIDPVLDRTRLFERLERAIRRAASHDSRRRGSAIEANGPSRRVPANRVPEA